MNFIVLGFHTKGKCRGLTMEGPGRLVTVTSFLLSVVLTSLPGGINITIFIYLW